MQALFLLDQNGNELNYDYGDPLARQRGYQAGVIFCMYTLLTEKHSDGVTDFALFSMETTQASGEVMARPVIQRRNYDVKTQGCKNDDLQLRS